MKRRWKQVRYRLEWLALVIALKLVPLLSRDACYRVAGAAGSLAARLDHRGCRVAVANLEAAFGDSLSPERREEIAREAYQHFARTMLDLLWSPRLDAGSFSQYVDEGSLQRLRTECGPSGRSILAAFHYGNFEWLALAAAWLGFAAKITTQQFKNPLLDDVFRRLRERSGNQVVEREGAIVRLYKALRKNGRIALLVDTTLPAHHPTVVIECFGLKTMVTVAHAWLHERTGAPIIPVHCEPLPHGRYKLVAHPKVHVEPGATHQEIAQACWDAIEPTIRDKPAPWMWMYKHWRYQPSGSEGYPFYSQPSPFFEQIAARPNYAKLDREAVAAQRSDAA